VLDTIRFTANDTLPQNIDLQVSGKGYFIGAYTFSIGSASNLPNRHIFDTSVTVVFGDGAVREVTIEWFGGKGDSVTDNAVAIRRALVAANGVPVVFAIGDYLINSPISLNGLFSIKLYGVGHGRNDTTAATALFCKNITGYTFQLTSGAAPMNIAFDGLLFDGFNGVGSTLQSYSTASTTWLGAFYSTVNATPYLFMDNCEILGSSSESAKALNLQYVFFAEFHNVRVMYIFKGYGVFAAIPFTPTTLTFNKCYFHGVRQIGYIQNSAGTNFTECVFESSIIGVATYYGRTSYNHCHFENMGLDQSGLSMKRGLSTKIYPVGGNIPINTVMYDHNGQVSFYDCNLGYTVLRSVNDSLKGFFEGSGLSGIYGSGGTAVFRDCYRSSGLYNWQYLFFNDSVFLTTNSRGTYVYEVYDGRGWYFGPSLKYIEDIRKVDKGTCSINLDTIEGTNGVNKYFVDIQKGNLIFGTDYSKKLTGRPYKKIVAIDTAQDTTIYPWIQGDCIIPDTPSLRGFERAICTRSGIDARRWTAGRTTALSEYVVPTVTNDRYYQCVQAGTTKVSQPTWSTTIGDTITDSTVKWICVGLPSVWAKSGVITKNAITFSLAAGKDTVVCLSTINPSEYHTWEIAINENSIARCFYKLKVKRINVAYPYYDLESSDQFAYSTPPSIVVYYVDKYAISIAAENAYGCQVLITNGQNISDGEFGSNE
jgi:hypothetical protein